MKQIIITEEEKNKIKSLYEQTTTQTTTVVPKTTTQTTTVVPPTAGIGTTDNLSGMINKKGTWSADQNKISLFNEKNQVVFEVRLNGGGDLNSEV
jgi:hypothetical protein